MATYKKSENTRELILTAASTLFYQKGYRATTVREIAKEANLSLSRLNYHFNSKADVAKYIVEKLLLNLGNEISALKKPEQDRIWFQELYIRIVEKFFLTESNTSQFLFEMANENYLHAMMLESGYRHFLRQANILGLDHSRQELRMYAHIFTSTMIQLFYAKHSGDLNSSDKEILDMCSKVHLMLLNIDKDDISNILTTTHSVVEAISFEIHDLTNPKLIISHQV